MADQSGWSRHVSFKPVRFAIDGARSYAGKLGLADPHQHSYEHVMQSPERVRDIGRHYDSLAHHDPAAVPHFEAMRKETGDQFHHLTHTMGVHVQTVDHDPYKDVHELVHDVSTNKRLQVLGTHATGGHPFFSDHENDQFRAVHDFFGHAATGRSFDRHGEEAAYRAHAAMFSHHARPALASETRGQNASLILNGDFGPQKIALLKPHHYDLTAPHSAMLMARYAAGWSGEDVIRHELGRQKVHTVNGEHELCPQHLRIRQSQNDFATGLAAQVGLPRQYSAPAISPPHEGRCTDCAKIGRGTDSPWEAYRAPGSQRVHEERQPTVHNEGDDEGMGYQRGRWPSRPHSNNGTERFVPVDTTIRSLNMRVAIALPGQQFRGIRVQAHDSGDGETIFHCFGGETRYWTQNGIKTLAETVGTTQKVLSNTGNGGTWVEAEIHDFGVQPLMKVTLRRNKRTKVVYATPEHRWLVRTRTDRAESRIVLTQDLRPEHRLASLLPRTAIARSTPSPFGIAHGVVYGDGTRAARGSVLNLWGEKDVQLLRYFAESRQEPIKTEQGVDGVRVLDLPAFFKARPDLEESVPYLYGWLAGYFAADGTVSKQGQVVMYSGSREDLEFFQLAAMRLGIGSYDIVEREREGFGEQRPLFQLQLIGSTLRPEFFLTREHRERYETVQARGNAERIGWTVDCVEETDRVETVYCAVVPEHENFVLDGLINTKNCPFCGSGQVIARSDGTVECEFCSTAFTVQVQPQMPAFPQTIDGVPVQVPGMPAGGQNANVPPGAAPGDPTDPGADPGAEDGDNPFASSGPPGADDSGDDEDDSDDDGKPAFLKGSMLLRTEDGARLTPEQYMRHLALIHSHDPHAVLVQIRRENGVR